LNSDVAKSAGIFTRDRPWSKAFEDLPGRGIRQDDRIEPVEQVPGLDVTIAQCYRSESIVFENPTGPSLVNHRNPGSIKPDAGLPGGDGSFRRSSHSEGLK